jgi:hypothetical protein
VFFLEGELHPVLNSQLKVKQHQFLPGTPDEFWHSFWVKTAMFWSLLSKKSGGRRQLFCFAKLLKDDAKKTAMFAINAKRRQFLARNAR